GALHRRKATQRVDQLGPRVPMCACVAVRACVTALAKVEHAVAIQQADRKALARDPDDLGDRTLPVTHEA
ncbi:hypothetical protein, partial [Enterobacter hormaechei]|uniref:hypothetical protein n=1 Tax=Enterobacter hormaechei TaxID=158836 RepID=UPI0013D4CD3D